MLRSADACVRGDEPMLVPIRDMRLRSNFVPGIIILFLLAIDTVRQENSSRPGSKFVCPQLRVNAYGVTFFLAKSCLIFRKISRRDHIRKRRPERGKQGQSLGIPGHVRHFTDRLERPNFSCALWPACFLGSAAPQEKPPPSCRRL